MENLNYIPEKDLENAPDYVETDTLEIILEQSRKSICKIKSNDKGNGTGFFCIIPFPDKFHPLPVLITNNHLIKENDIQKGAKIKFTLNNDKLSFEIVIDELRRVYTNEIYDITIIEIKEKDNLEMNSFLEIDDQLFKDNANDIYRGKSIYLLSHPKGGKSTFSLGIIKNIEEDEYTIIHLCKTNPGSSGCPIINLNNNRVIGIHKGASKKYNWNLGILLNKSLKEFEKEKNSGKNSQNKIKKDQIKNPQIIKTNNKMIINEINIKYKIKNESVIKIFGKNFVKNNKNICKLIYEDKEYELQETFNVNNNNKQILEIKLTGINKITDMSCMFEKCNSLISSSEISNWDTSNITNMACLFSNCKSLEYIPDISYWNTSKVKYMQGMFKGCSSLKELPDISKWNTSNVIYFGGCFSSSSSLITLSLLEMKKYIKDNKYYFIGGMFYECKSLISLPDISNWNTSNVINMSYLFDGCNSLLSLPDISKWNVSKVVDFNYMLYNCKSLLSLPDISNWIISDSIYLSGVFTKCKSLSSLPDISKWDISKVIDISSLFSGCESLLSLPDISKWNTSNVTDMMGMFAECKLLSSLSDISKWNTSKVTDMSHMFSLCEKLSSLPDISKWNTSKVTDMSNMFAYCLSLVSLPNLSKWNINNVTNLKDIFDGCNKNLNIPSKFNK